MLKIKKFTMCILSAFIISLCGANIYAYAAEKTELNDTLESNDKCGENITWTLNDGILKISGYGRMYDYSISEVPWERDKVSSVQIENGVTYIGEFAFSKCRLLTDISLPKSLERIGGGAFCQCKALTRIVIPSGVTSIPASAFSDCNYLKSVEMGDSVLSIGSNAFENCSGLSEISLKNVKIIGDMAFYGCSGLEKLIIPESVSEIGDKAFGTADNISSSLKEIVFQTTKAVVSSDAFQNISADVYYNEGQWSSFESYGGNLKWKAKHNMQYVPEKRPDCTTDGTKAYWKCTNEYCAGKMFADENAENEISQQQLVIKAYGHDWTEQKYNPCTDVQIAYICRQCGKMKTEPRKAAHIPSEPEEEIIKAPESFEDAGSCDEVVYCSVCRQAIKRITRPLVYNISLSDESYIYDGTYKRPKVTITLGSKPIAEYLYDIEYTDNINAGEGHIKIIAKSGVIVKGSASRSFKILPQPLDKQTAVLSRNTYVYSGKQRKPSVKIDNLEYGTDYTVLYQNNINVGEAYAIVKGKGNYSGELKPIAYKISPKSIELSKLSDSSKGIAALWKSQKVQTDGYQLAYSVKKDFSSQKIKNISDKKKNSYIIKKSANAKRYYVKIRVYTLVNNKKYYSEWSEIKSIKIK